MRALERLSPTQRVGLLMTIVGGISIVLLLLPSTASELTSFFWNPKLVLTLSFFECFAGLSLLAKFRWSRLVGRSYATLSICAKVVGFVFLISGLMKAGLNQPDWAEPSYLGIFSALENIGRFLDSVGLVFEAFGHAIKLAVVAWPIWIFRQLRNTNDGRIPTARALAV